MAASIPPQRHRCPVHEWCTEAGPVHEAHVGEVHVLTTARGLEFRVSLNAEGDAAPVVQMEAAFERSGPLMDLAELDPAEALELAGFLLRLARVAEVERTGSTDL
ncbi:MAG TPA: hypothetical protein VLB29_12490 [Nocardioidaceae bacterium]|nr:hypothetical protein [Nocardioidaceae bacterium]